jgi:vacuolar-type H+-ATPase subunit E/Vma4
MHGSVASVIASIRDEVAAEVERIERAGAADVARSREKAATTVVTIADRDLRIAAARREIAERLAQEEWESRRAAAEQREEWIARVIARGRELLGEIDVRDALVREALAHLPAGEHETTIAPCGGVIVACGNVVFDNSFDSRARRLEPEWRKALSEVYR